MRELEPQEWLYWLQTVIARVRPRSAFVVVIASLVLAACGPMPIKTTAPTVQPPGPGPSYEPQPALCYEGKATTPAICRDGFAGVP